MSTEAVLLQAEMFTGEWVKRYPKVHAQQTGMFSAEKMTELTDQRPRAWLNQASSLALIGVDLRTPEEQAADLQREAGKLTAGLFPTEAAPAVAVTPDPISPANQASESVMLVDTSLPRTETITQADEDKDEDESPALAPLSLYAAYLELVQLAQEQAATLAATPVTQLSQAIALNVAKLNAKSAGLTPAEITAALTIGTFRGHTEVQPPPTEHPSPLPQVATLMQITLTALCSPITEETERTLHQVPPTDNPITFSLWLVREWLPKFKRSDYGGLCFPALRFWLEQTSRLLERDTPTIPYPVLSVRKADLLATRPDLKDAIATLDGDEMRQIAQMMEDALHKDYLNALALALDWRFSPKLPNAAMTG